MSKTSARKGIVTFGEIMLRLSPADPGQRTAQADRFLAEPGGSESNVAVALAQLGEPAAFASVLPDNDLGRKVLRHLRAHGVDTSRVRLSEGRLGLYWTETGCCQRPYQVLYDREGSAFSRIRPADIEPRALLDGAGWLHVSGICPALGPAVCAATKKLLRGAGRVTVSLDLNHRAKLWTWLRGRPVSRIMRDLAGSADVLVGNETDFRDCLGLTGPYPDVAGACFRRSRRLKYVAVSLRETVSASRNTFSGLLFARGAGAPKAYHAPTYALDHIVDRVGAGDAFCAGLIHGLRRHPGAPQKALDFAAALGALKHTVRGDAAPFSAAEVERLVMSPDARIRR